MLKNAEEWPVRLGPMIGRTVAVVVLHLIYPINNDLRGSAPDQKRVARPGHARQDQ